MSLRVDIHEAVDEVVTDESAMAARVVSALAVTPARAEPGDGGRRRFVAPLRGVGALVAVLVVVALIAGALAGGRVWQDWNSFSARQPQPSPRLDMALVAQLEQRPLDLSVIPAGAVCPTGPYGAYAGYGAGPVSLIGGLAQHSHWGNYFNGLAYVDARVTGPVIGRGLDLKTGRGVVFIGDRAFGAVVRTDTLQGIPVQQRAEALLDTDRPPQTVVDGGKLYVWGVHVGLDVAASGCTGFQFDGAGFHETLVVSGDFGVADFYWHAAGT